MKVSTAPDAREKCTHCVLLAGSGAVQVSRLMLRTSGSCRHAPRKHPAHPVLGGLRETRSGPRPEYDAAPKRKYRPRVAPCESASCSCQSCVSVPRPVPQSFVAWLFLAPVPVVFLSCVVFFGVSSSSVSCPEFPVSHVLFSGPFFLSFPLSLYYRLAGLLGARAPRQ